MSYRYALYFAPEPDSDFESAGAACIGRNARTGWSGKPLPVEGIPAKQMELITASPRRYGFHGTLKAPFRLAEGELEVSLLEAISHMAGLVKPFTMPQLAVSRLGSFLALIPREESNDLRDLADRCVSMLDGFRSPLTPEERARRQPEHLSSSQRNNLDRWGYPYVFDEFRFHMTLTGPVGAGDSERLIQSYQTVFNDILSKPVQADAVTLFVQEEPDQPFSIRQRFLLGQ